MRLDIGERVVVTNPKSGVGAPDDVQQLVHGLAVTLTRFTCQITMLGVPEAPHHIGIYGDTRCRYSPDDCTLNGAHDSTDTSLSVTLGGVAWSATDGDFDIVVAGERMTVTATGIGISPQTLTVTRAVNGVVKSHADGEPVALFDPSYYTI